MTNDKKIDLTQNNIVSLLRQSIEAVLNVSKPCACLPQYLPPPPPSGKIIVIGAGKASAEMGRIFEKEYIKNHPHVHITGAVVTRYGHAVPTNKIKILQAAHPIPDSSCINAVEEIFKTIETATPEDLIVCLLSGGGSALLSAPINGITFQDIQKISKDLLLSGAQIHEINTLRKHLNRALGGGLALAAQDIPMVTLAISDVNKNDPSVIASGPTVCDETTLSDCHAILKKYNITPGKTIISALAQKKNETAKADHPAFRNKTYQLIATPETAIDTAENFWQKRGFHTINLGTNISGDTNSAAQQHINILKAQATECEKPLAIISGGETTVKVTGNGKGGPNAQFVLQATILLGERDNIYVMAYDTDGIDGSEHNGGAIFTPQTNEKIKALRLHPKEFLSDNNAFEFFKALDDLIITGPTHTNVNDYRVILRL